MAESSELALPHEAMGSGVGGGIVGGGVGCRVGL
jgi:hypothetical protein